MIIYHGSDKKIDKPVMGAGKKYNDYGYGFYCTEHYELAAEWAVDEDRNGFVNKYEIALGDMKVLNLNTPEYSILNWITILLENRLFEIQSSVARAGKKFLKDNYNVDYKAYDIIIGYRADDSYFSYAQDFLDNSISVQQLEAAMKLGNLGEQIVIKSKSAFDRIKFVSAEEVYKKDWFNNKKERDNRARKKYFDMRNEEYRPGELYITGLMDRNIGGADVRIQ